MSQIIEMRLLGSILDKLVSVGVIALIVIFQEDIRKVLYNLGAHRRRVLIKALSRFLTAEGQGERPARNQGGGDADGDGSHEHEPGKVGALIVIERSMPLDDIVMTGDTIDANINQRLIENIFFKNSPLHDGAMVISNPGASRPQAVSSLSATT